MKPPLALLVLTGALTAGCATLMESPPSPPLAVPALGTPKEFAWAPIKWRPGHVLTYQVHSSMETNPGDTDHEREVIELRAIDTTATGAVRVQVRVDNVDLGSLLIGDRGQVYDAMAATPGSAVGLTALEDAAQMSLARRRPAKPISVGDTFTWELPATWLRRLIRLDWGADLPARLPVQAEFVGYVRLGGALAAALRYKGPNLLRSPIHARDRHNRELRFEVLASEGVEYFDASAGYSLAKHEVVTAGGTLGGQPYAVRAMRVTTLDRARSRGLPPAGRPVPATPPRVSMPKDAPAPGTAVIELSRDDLPSAEHIRSTSLAVFGVTLGSSYEDTLRAVSSLGRPVKEMPLNGASLKGVSIYAGDDEARVEHRMALFVARANVVTEIHLNGSDRPVSTPDTPVYKGFDSLAVGHTRTLLTDCMTTARASILGDQDRATTTEFPGGHGGFLRRYEYDRVGLDVSHLRRTREPASWRDPPALYEQCFVRLRPPGPPQ
jgi:hypothetical protein